MTSAARSDRASRDAAFAADRELDSTRFSRLGRLSGSERAWLIGSTGAFFAVAAALALFLPSDRSPSLFAVALLVIAYAAAFEFDFEVRGGSAVPTPLVLVPMLFVLPTGVVPLAVAGAIVLASAFDALRGPLDAERVFLRLMSAWHAVGPALVLGLAGEPVPALSDWALYLLALAAQVAVAFVVGAVRERVVLGVSPLLHLRAMRWTFVVDGALAGIGLAVTLAAAESSVALVIALPLVAVLAVLARERGGRLDEELELRDAYRRAATLLSHEDARDGARRDAEAANVVRLAVAVADELRLPPRERRDAEFAALLNAVAKSQIPSEIVNKPGPLTNDEWAVVREHTIEGERILLQVGGLVGRLGRIVRSCHERYDGEGYPDALAGEEIPLVARIVACCDAFTAMTSERPYRPARSSDDALAELRRNRRTQFDPRVADALIAVIERG